MLISCALASVPAATLRGTLAPVAFCELLPLDERCLATDEPPLSFRSRRV